MFVIRSVLGNLGYPKYGSTQVGFLSPDGPNDHMIERLNGLEIGGIRGVI